MGKKKTAKKKVTRKSASGGVTKSQAIRDQLKKTPRATASAIAEAASQQMGEKVSAALVYQVKAAEANKKGRGKKGAKQATATADGGVNAGLIKEAAELLNRAGDAKAAKEALDAATAIAKVLNK